jgi:hypothetical protein
MECSGRALFGHRLIRRLIMRCGPDAPKAIKISSSVLEERIWIYTTALSLMRGCVLTLVQAATPSGI